MALAQCLSNVEDVGPALYKCCTGVEFTGSTTTVYEVTITLI